MPLSKHRGKEESRNPVAPITSSRSSLGYVLYFLNTLTSASMVTTILSVVAVFLLDAYMTPSSAGFVVCRSKPIGRWPLKSDAGAGHVAQSVAFMSARVDDATREEMRAGLLELIGDTPRNAPTPKSTTNEILAKVKRLEDSCPTAEDDDVLKSLGGAWELLWTAQVGLLCRCLCLHLSNSQVSF